MKKVVLVVLGLFFFIIFVGVIIIFFGVPKEISERDTKFTPGFSYGKLYSIKLGMTENDAKQIMGNPLYAGNSTDYPDCWDYSQPSTKWSDFLGWEDNTVCFDKAGKVIGVGSNIFYN